MLRYFLSLIIILSTVANAQIKQRWAGTVNGSDDEFPYDICFDTDGNTLLTGYYRADGDFDIFSGSYDMTASGFGDVFIQKLKPDGNLEWAHTLTNANWNGGGTIATDDFNNVYVGGFFEGTVDFDPDISTANKTAVSGRDGFLVKYDPDGVFQWVATFGASGNSAVGDIAFDLSGNIVVTGYFHGTVDLDPGPFSSSSAAAGSADAFVAKLDADGNYMWGHGFGNVNYDASPSVAVDYADNIVVVGDFENLLDFDPGPGTAFSTSLGAQDPYISKFDADGNHLWVVSTGGLGSDIASEVAIDESDNIYVAGSFSGVADFDPSATVLNKTSLGFFDAFVWVITPDSDYLKVYTFGSSLDDKALDVHLDELDHIYVGGKYGGTIDFDPGASVVSEVTTGNSDVFVLKLDEAGTYQYHETIGSPGNEGTYFNMDIDHYHDIVFCSEFNTTIDLDPSLFDSDTHSPVGGQDFFVTRFCETKYSTISVSECGEYVSPSGLYTWDMDGTYQDTIPAFSGCDSIISISLTIKPEPTIIAGPDQLVCEGDTVILSGSATGGTAPYTYMWNDGIINGDPFFPPPGLNIYVVTGTDADGCENTDTVSVDVHTAPIVSTSGDQVFCLGDSVHLSAGGASTYYWDDGASLTEDYSLLPSDDSTIVVIGYSAEGCATTRFVELTKDNPALVSAGGGAVECIGHEVTLEAFGGIDYHWFGNGIDDTYDAIVQFIADTNAFYYCEITSAAGCVYLDSAFVTLGDPLGCPSVIAYNALTPNSDGKNDFLEILGIEYTPSNEVMVFNRWGDQVWNTVGYDNSDPDKRWEGQTNNGVDCHPGTYYVLLQVNGKLEDAQYVQVIK